MDKVCRSYFEIPTGQSQLFSENSSQLLANLLDAALCRSTFRHIYSRKSHNALKNHNVQIERHYYL